MQSKLGVYVNQNRIKKNDMFKLGRGDIITFGVDLSKKENSKDSFKFLSFELKFKLNFIDLTLSDDEIDETERKTHRKQNNSVKMLIKTTENGLKTVENVPKRRNNKRSSSCSSSDDKKEKETKQKEKKAKKKIERMPKNEIKSDETNDIENVWKKTFERVSQNECSPRKEPSMVEIPKNSHLNEPRYAIQLDALPQMNGKRRANENIQSTSKILSVESTSKSPIPMQSPREITQNNVQMNHELIKKMINWKYTHMKAGQKYTIKLNTIPLESFESLDTFKK